MEAVRSRRTTCDLPKAAGPSLCPWAKIRFEGALQDESQASGCPWVLTPKVEARLRWRSHGLLRGLFEVPFPRVDFQLAPEASLSTIVVPEPINGVRRPCRSMRHAMEGGRSIIPCQNTSAINTGTY